MLTITWLFYVNYRVIQYFRTFLKNLLNVFSQIERFWKFSDKANWKETFELCCMFFQSLFPSKSSSNFVLGCEIMNRRGKLCFYSYKKINCLFTNSNFFVKLGYSTEKGTKHIFRWSLFPWFGKNAITSKLYDLMFHLDHAHIESVFEWSLAIIEQNFWF